MQTHQQPGINPSLPHRPKDSVARSDAATAAASGGRSRLPSAAMIGEGITYCPRCGAALPRPTVACARRSCRPAALRLVRLQPVDTESKMNVVLPSSLSQADPEPQPADPVTPLSVVTPALQQQLSLEENSR